MLLLCIKKVFMVGFCFCTDLAVTFNLIFMYNIGASDPEQPAVGQVMIIPMHTLYPSGESKHPWYDKHFPHMI